MANQTRRSRAVAIHQRTSPGLIWGFAITLFAALVLIAFTSPSFAAGSIGGGGFGGTTSTTRERERPPSPTRTREYRQAVKLINKEQYSEAITMLLALNEQHPGNADILNYLGYAHRQLDQDDAAMDYYMQALAVKPNHKGANEYLGELYLKLGEVEKAEEQLAKLDDICTFGCSEYRDLKASIEAFKADQSAS